MAHICKQQNIFKYSVCVIYVHVEVKHIQNRLMHKKNGTQSVRQKEKSSSEPFI